MTTVAGQLAWAEGRRLLRNPAVWLSLIPVAMWFRATNRTGDAEGALFLLAGYGLLLPGFVMLIATVLAVLRGRMERFFGLTEAFVGCEGAQVLELRYGEEGFAASFQSLAAEGHRPTALFCSHDGLAVHVVSELHRLGYKVPSDVSIVGYGDFAAAMQISPPLTTIRLPGEDMGTAAFRLLLERMNGNRRQLPPQRVMVVPKLIERESVATREVEPDAHSL